MNLEVARADRHGHPVSLAACGGERLGDRGLRDPEEPQDAPPGSLCAAAQREQRLRLEHPWPELLQLARRPRERDCHARSGVQDDGRRRADEPHPLGSLGQGGLLAHTVRKVRVRTVQPLGHAARQGLDLAREPLVHRERPAGSAREQLDRAVVVRRAEAPGDDEEILVEAGPQRGLELGGLVADHGDPDGIDAELQQ